MKALFIYTSLFYISHIFAINNFDGASTISKDDYSHYQWGLVNQGEKHLAKQYRDQAFTSGKKGVDIGWSRKLILEIHAKMQKKNPVVAVIDQGIDLDHPDLKHAIYTNAKECEVKKQRNLCLENQRLMSKEEFIKGQRVCCQKYLSTIISEGFGEINLTLSSRDFTHLKSLNNDSFESAIPDITKRYRFIHELEKIKKKKRKKKKNKKLLKLYKTLTAETLSKLLRSEIPTCEKHSSLAVLNLNILENQDYFSCIERAKVQVNEKSCLEKFPLATDADKNGFPGDCQGWNFLHKDKDLSDAQNVDQTGDHGTFVSGIIAAKMDNTFGITGVSDQIRILPIRAISPLAGDIEQIKKEYKVPFAKRMVLSLDYATNMGVDAINISAIWPGFMHSQELDKKIREVAQRIPIIVAAGNDSTYAKFYPCIISGVICVGNMNLNGEKVFSSNFGGAVDFLAPGTEIVSTTGINDTSISMNTDFIGIDVRTGSSFAAPYISGMVALIKGINPKLSPTQIKQLLTLSSHFPEPDQNRYSQQGLPNLAKIISLMSKGNWQNSIIVTPVFKEVKRSKLVVGYDDKIQTNIPFILPVDLNFNVLPDELAISVKSLTDGISFTEVKHLSKTELEKSPKVSFSGVLSDYLVNSKLKYKVTLKYNDNGEIKIQEFINSMDLVLEGKRYHQKFAAMLGKDQSFVAYKKINDDTFHIKPFLNVVQYPFKRPRYPDLISTPVNKKENMIEVRVYRYREVKRDNNGKEQVIRQYAEVGKKDQQVGFVNAFRINKVISFDMNEDGHADFLFNVDFIEENNGQKYLRNAFVYKDHNLEPLFKDQSTFYSQGEFIPKGDQWLFYSQGAPLNLQRSQWRFIKSKTKHDEIIYLPVLLSSTNMPLEEQGTFVVKDRSIKKRVFQTRLDIQDNENVIVFDYLDLEGILENYISENINQIDTFSPIVVNSLMVQDFSSLKSGEVKGLMFKQIPFIFSLNNKGIRIEVIDYKFLDKFSLGSYLAGYSLLSNKPRNFRIDHYFNYIPGLNEKQFNLLDEVELSFSPLEIRKGSILNLNEVQGQFSENENIIHYQTDIHNSIDYMMNHIAIDNRPMSFLKTRNQTQVVTVSDKGETQQFALNNETMRILPNWVLKNVYVPTVAWVNGRYRAGIKEKSLSIDSSWRRLFIFDGRELYAPLTFSEFTPRRNCGFIGETNSRNSFMEQDMYLCLDEREVEVAIGKKQKRVFWYILSSEYLH